MDWKNITVELEKKLDPAHVIKPTGKYGPKGDYIMGWHTIAEANRIFGFDGWSYTIGLIENDIREVTKGDKTQWQVAYSCVCTVTVGTTVRQDVGFGSGFAKNIGDAIESATKEAATDSLKRALRTFGNPFGLALYDKTRENVGIDEPEFDAPAAHDHISKAMDACENKPDLLKLWGAERSTAVLIGGIDKELGAQLFNKFNKRRGELSEPPPPNDVDEIPF